MPKKLYYENVRSKQVGGFFLVITQYCAPNVILQNMCVESKRETGF